MYLSLSVHLSPHPFNVFSVPHLLYLWPDLCCFYKNTRIWVTNSFSMSLTFVLLLYFFGLLPHQPTNQPPIGPTTTTLYNTHKKTLHHHHLLIILTNSTRGGWTRVNMPSMGSTLIIGIGAIAKVSMRWAMCSSRAGASECHTHRPLLITVLLLPQVGPSNSSSSSNTRARC